MWFASALVENRLRDVMFYSSVIAAYCLGVGAFRRAELSYKNKALNGLFAPIVAGFLVLGDYMTWRDPAARWVPALLLSFAWAIINSGELDVFFFTFMMYEIFLCSLLCVSSIIVV